MLDTLIGGYRVVEKLAEGGMGEVFIARHELMQRDAVIKVLLPALSAHQEMVGRFLNEARAVNQIHHGGIVEVFDLGFLPSGQAFIAMERLRGESLGERLRRGVLSIPQATALTRQLARALGAAHAVGIVHRDLKPDNLFLCPDASVRDPVVDGGERLKILDFGIAKVAQGAGAVKTVAGAVFGTPAYMSPEQCASAGQVDGRSDLYAVGCILYEALCGRPPFGQGGLELIAAHIRDTAPPARSLNPAIPVELDRVIGRLLEKDPARRPQSCAELLGLLEATSAAPRELAPTVMAAGSVPPSGVASSSTPPPVAAIPSAAAVPAGSGRSRTLALAVAGLAVAGVAVTVVVMMGGDDRPRAATPTSPSAPALTAGAVTPSRVPSDLPGGDVPPAATPSTPAVATPVAPPATAPATPPATAPVTPAATAPATPAVTTPVTPPAKHTAAPARSSRTRCTVNGDLPTAVVEKYVTRALPQISSCHEQGRLADPLGVGAGVGVGEAELVIENKGLVDSVTVTGLSAGLVNCARGALGRLHFPAPRSGGLVMAHCSLIFK